MSILSQLEHPNIITLVGICLRPKPMLILEYAELGSLASFSPYRRVSHNLKHRIAIQVIGIMEGCADSLYHHRWLVLWPSSTRIMLFIVI